MKKETSRRDFLATAGAAMLFAGGCRYSGSREPGGLAGPETIRHKRIAAQLKSIDKVFWSAPAKYLKELRTAGFEGVEFSGYVGKDGRKHSAREIALLLSDAGLDGTGTQVEYKDNWIGDGLKRNLEFCAEAGFASCILGWYKAQDLDQWKRFVETMSIAAETGRRCGIRVGYRNHFHELEENLDNMCVWDYVFHHASPHLCQQIDTARAIKGGIDPLALIRRYPARNWSIIIKENLPDPIRPNAITTPVDFKRITNFLNDDPGFRWYVLEDTRDQTSTSNVIELAKNFTPFTI